MSTCACWSGARVIRQRIATIGSSTEPAVPDRAAVSTSAIGSRVLRPRPMKAARSVW